MKIVHETGWYKDRKVIGGFWHLNADVAVRAPHFTFSVTFESSRIGFRPCRRVS